MSDAKELNRRTSDSTSSNSPEKDKISSNNSSSSGQAAERISTRSNVDEENIESAQIDSKEQNRPEKIPSTDDEYYSIVPSLRSAVAGMRPVLPGNSGSAEISEKAAPPSDTSFTQNTEESADDGELSLPEIDLTGNSPEDTDSIEFADFLENFLDKNLEKRKQISTVNSKTVTESTSSDSKPLASSILLPRCPPAAHKSNVEIEKKLSKDLTQKVVYIDYPEAGDSTMRCRRPEIPSTDDEYPSSAASSSSEGVSKMNLSFTTSEASSAENADDSVNVIECAVSQVNILGGDGQLSPGFVKSKCAEIVGKFFDENRKDVKGRKQSSSSTATVIEGEMSPESESSLPSSPELFENVETLCRLKLHKRLTQKAVYMEDLGQTSPNNEETVDQSKSAGSVVATPSGRRHSAYTESSQTTRIPDTKARSSIMSHKPNIQVGAIEGRLSSRIRVDPSTGARNKNSTMSESGRVYATPCPERIDPSVGRQGEVTTRSVGRPSAIPILSVRRLSAGTVSQEKGRKCDEKSRSNMFKSSNIDVGATEGSQSSFIRVDPSTRTKNKNSARCESRLASTECSEKIDDIIHCLECDTRYSKLASAAQHFLNSHPNQVEIHFCSECYIIFFTEFKFRQHQRSHH